MANLNLYASVTEHDADKRRELLEQLRRTGIEPEVHDDKIEFRYRGGRDLVIKLATYAESHRIRSVHISSGAKD